jgi:hypothetical protein
MFMVPMNTVFRIVEIPAGFHPSPVVGADVAFKAIDLFVYGVTIRLTSFGSTGHFQRSRVGTGSLILKQHPALKPR